MAHGWEIPQFISDGLACLLICRLVLLRLHAVYRVFCAFLLFDLLSSGIAFVELNEPNAHTRYGITFIGLRVIAWILSLWMVYALLDAVLENFRGILKFSRKLLNGTFVLAILVALSTAKPQYVAGGLNVASADPITRALGLTFVLERVICSAALLALLAILAFILWFPVRLPRNLVVFSIGYVAYFAINTGLLLVQSFVSHSVSQGIGNAMAILLSLCFAYMALTITAEGEAKSVSLGHRWNVADQHRLMCQLEDMNAALLRAAARR
ncbi:MAG TPA: hypothetical protein VFB14_18970 [Bryobacteraceae bacterium]|jgi:hypothetical protein|nr:hypothetical protein [Bryobacteraceae bacterium]